MARKKKVSEKKITKSTAPAVNVADKKTAETVIAARKRRHTG